MMLSLSEAALRPRLAERISSKRLAREPPQRRCWPQFPVIHAEPSTGWLIVVLVRAILDPLPDIANHVIQTELVRREGADRSGLCGVALAAAAGAIGIIGASLVSPGIGRLRPSGRDNDPRDTGRAHCAVSDGGARRVLVCDNCEQRAPRGSIWRGKSHRYSRRIAAMSSSRAPSGERWRS
jgi:hypothetical protein